VGDEFDVREDCCAFSNMPNCGFWFDAGEDVLCSLLSVAAELFS
jgi:hypothetical protein